MFYGFVRVILLVACVLPGVTVAAEDPLLVLVRLLRDNGTLSEEAYRTMHEAIQARLAQQSLPSAATPASPGQQGPGPERSRIDQRGRLEFRSADGAFRTRIGGRIQADYDAFDGDVAAQGSGSEIRRARLFVSGTLWRDWAYKLQYDFVNSGRSGIKDAWLRYTALPAGNLTVGHFKEPWSLENMSSSKYVTFIERALPEAFSPGRSIGLALAGGGSRWSATAGVFGEGVGRPASAAAGEGYGIAGRLTGVPFQGEEDLLHLGLALGWRDTGSGDRLSLSSRPEAHTAAVKLVDTGSFDAESLLRVGTEISWIHGPFNLQGEYMGMAVQRKGSGNKDPWFQGWYLQGSWFLTGESRRYRGGSFRAIRPRSALGQGGWGAWELALRYSGLDLSDEDIAGGREQNLTLGLNWYPVSNLRFMADYVHVLDVEGGPHPGDEPSVLSLRAQVEF